MESKTIITAYSLIDLLQQLQTNLKDGYVFDLESVENYPQSFGGYFVVPMVDPSTIAVKKEPSKEEETVVQLTQATEEVAEQKEPKQRRTKQEK